MDDRALIFTNLLNGVPLAEVARTFRRGEKDVLDTFGFVLRKVKSYAFERRMPPVVAATVDEARRHRLLCLSVVGKLNLDKDPRYARIVTETVTGDNALTIAKDLRG